MIRVAANRRPWTFGNAAGIHEFTASVFMSFVTRPLRNITASAPLTRMRARDDKSMSPAPSLRTVAYSANGPVVFIQEGLSSRGFAAAHGGKARPYREAPFQDSEAMPRCLRRSLKSICCCAPVRQASPQCAAAEPQELLRHVGARL